MRAIPYSQQIFILLLKCFTNLVVLRSLKKIGTEVPSTCISTYTLSKKIPIGRGIAHVYINYLQAHYTIHIDICTKMLYICGLCKYLALYVTFTSLLSYIHYIYANYFISYYTHNLNILRKYIFLYGYNK